jgi:dihydroxy-acid dehydratase
MSGIVGTIVLHIAPETAIGGPLAAVQDGDIVSWILRNILFV